MNNTIAVNTGSEENSNIANITLNSPNFFPLISEVSKSHNQYCPVKDGIDGIHETTHHCLLNNLSVDYGTQNHHKHLKLNQILIPKQCNMPQTLPTLKYDDTLNLELGVNLSMIDLNEKVGTEKKQHLSHICFEDIDSKCYAYSSSTYQNNSQISSKSLIKAHSHNSFLTNHTYSKTECCMGHFLNERTSIAHLAMTEEWSKKSQNMTECVPVPSSEHVAEIVGRQGCKIKALRAKTNTYIKTPVRNEEPVFVVTGRKEDVTKAKREILSAAEHFTLIRATRRGEANVAIVKNGSMEATQSQMTIKVRVPYRVVGLVVGPKGNTIKHIQQETQTYIVTPSRDKEPIFEITGLKYNVQAARKHIETHIATRTMGTNSVSNFRRESSTTSKNTHLEVNISLPKSSAGEQFNIDCTNNRNSMHQINNQQKKQICVNDPKTTIGIITENVIKYPLKPENAKTRLLSSLKSTVPLKSKFSNISSSPPNDFNLLSIMHRKDTYLSAFNSLNINDKSNVHVECLPNNFNTTYEYFQQTSNNELEESSVTRDILKSNLCDPEVNIIRKQEFIATNNQNIDVNKSQDTQHNNLLDNPVNFSVPLLDTFNDFEQHSLHLVSAPAFKVFKTYVPNTFNAREVIGCFENATNVNILTRPCSSASSNASSSSRSLSQYSNGTAVGPYEKKSTPYQKVLDIDKGFGESPTVRKLPKKLAVIKCSYYPNSISPSDSSYINYSEMHTKPIIIHRPIEHTSKTRIKRDCCICHEKDMVAALIPCGHKMFCVDCANTICASKKPICPFCCMKVYQAIKILN